MKEFDFARLRQNWDRAAEPPTPPLPPRLALVEVPRDPYPVAQRLLDEIGGLVRARCAGRMPSLGPFLAEAVDLLARLRAASAPDSRLGPPPAEPKEDPAALRKQLERALFDLEDLLEVALGVGLR